MSPQNGMVATSSAKPITYLIRCGSSANTCPIFTILRNKSKKPLCVTFYGDAKKKKNISCPSRGVVVRRNGLQMSTRTKVELFSPEYWKAWKERSNVGPAVDPVEEARKAAVIRKEREDRLVVLNKRGYTYSHPNKGWVEGTGAHGEPNSMLADALAGGKDASLDYRPANDKPSMIDLVGHNGDGVTGPFRSTYRGGPQRIKTTLFGKSERLRNEASAGRPDVDH